MTLPVRRRTGRAKGRPVQRASAGLSAVRAVAALALLGISGALYAVTTVDEFRLDPQRVTIGGAVHTSDEAARTALGLTGGARPNLFRLRTDELADSLRRLPAVVDAGVTVTLPDRLDVVLTERSPIMVWEVAGVRLLVDIDGVMFARAPGAELPAGLPLIVDRRARPAPPADGERLDRVDLAAVRQLAAVTPEMLGSRAARLRVSVDDVEGFTLDAEPERWHAVFGFYTAQLRSPDIIPGQVQCLTALLASGEDAIRTVILAPADERCGTFRARPTPSGGPSPRPSRSPRPSVSPAAPSSPAASPTGSPGAEPSA